MECRKEECSNYYSCQYLYDRFHVVACSPNKKLRDKQINEVHQKELENRKRLLEEISNARRS
ncbi:hypothetical protein [Clostridium butyricum]|uniref:Uncharacterized protein n=1 Tax=Clostridium butyricum E4 str. BoNT E BL5262 TaxID=632245 RepID=C4IFD3_CLOBU|nr:hypothetical protein [Clostridium butyricum]EEP55020.1 hypothetical protein CLP_1637 [Clostridium butyricum E4 str. BoNT E BL5262]NFL32877.1 hypothetical protein [Clostridium butyricum]NFS20251.1 hypothetical protein [Clostridium butyricum]